MNKVAIKDIESKNPGIFGPKGGLSRGLSMSSMSWTMGCLLGPVISGFLVESVGYYKMNCVLGTYSYFYLSSLFIAN